MTRPNLTIVPERRVPIDLPDQHETEEERLYTASELVFACYLAGFVSVMVTLGAAFVWSLYL